MIAYVDTSVILRVILAQADPLREWDDLELGVSNHLSRVEALRTLDRFWHQSHLNEVDVENKRRDVQIILDRFELIPLDQQLLTKASQSFPTIIGTLDAIHLATAMAYREKQPSDERPIVLATHDKSLARAAREMHFEVIGG